MTLRVVTDCRPLQAATLSSRRCLQAASRQTASTATLRLYTSSKSLQWFPKVLSLAQWTCHMSTSLAASTLHLWQRGQSRKRRLPMRTCQVSSMDWKLAQLQLCSHIAYRPQIILFQARPLLAPKVACRVCDLMLPETACTSAIPAWQVC